MASLPDGAKANLNSAGSSPATSVKAAVPSGGFSVHDRVIALDAHESGVVVGSLGAEGKVIVRLSSGKQIPCDPKRLRKDQSRQASSTNEGIRRSSGVTVVRGDSSKVRHKSRNISEMNDQQGPPASVANETARSTRPPASTSLPAGARFARGDQVVVRGGLDSCNDVLPVVHIPKGSRGTVRDGDDDGDILVDFESIGEHWLGREDLGSVIKVKADAETPREGTPLEAALSLSREAVQPPRGVSQPPSSGSSHVSDEASNKFAYGDYIAIRQDVVSANDETDTTELPRGSCGRVLKIEEGDLLVLFAKLGRHWVSSDDLKAVQKMDPKDIAQLQAKRDIAREQVKDAVQTVSRMGQTVSRMEQEPPVVPQRDNVSLQAEQAVLQNGIAPLHAELAVLQRDVLSLQVKHAALQREVALSHVVPRTEQVPAVSQRDILSLQVKHAALQREVASSHVVPRTEQVPAVFQRDIASLQAESRREQAPAVSQRDIDALEAELARVRLERLEAEARCTKCMDQCRVLLSASL